MKRPDDGAQAGGPAKRAKTDGVSRVFVGNLSYQTTWQGLKEYFGQIGEVEFASVLQRPDGKSKGCGMVNFTNPLDAARAVEQMNESVLDGRNIMVKLDFGGDSKRPPMATPMFTPDNMLTVASQLLGLTEQVPSYEGFDDLGMSAIKDKKTVERELVMMNIQADDDGFIYFNELLYKTMKRRYAYGRTKKKVLYELELDTLEKLEKIMTKQIFLSRKKERQKAVAVNPFMSMMYKNMSFNVWREIFMRNLPKRLAHMQLGLEREISDEEEDEEEVIEFEYVYETEEIEEIEEVEEQNPVIQEEELEADEMDFDDGLLPHEREQLRHEEEILGGHPSNRFALSPNQLHPNTNRGNSQRALSAQRNTGGAQGSHRNSNQFASPSSKRGLNKQ